jgi:gamma-glutamyl-gamma-aminobutyrate hydrolase PuuD
MNALVTMREEFDKHGQRVSNIEESYINFLTSLKLNPVLVSNTKREPSATIKSISDIDLIVLSGGGDPTESKSQRIRIEHDLIVYAKNNSIPILAICRGMQVFLMKENEAQLSYLDKANSIDRAPGKRHWMKTDLGQIEINHYHNYFFKFSDAIFKNAIFGLDSDTGSIETIFLQKEKFLGFQWHPEREDDNSKAQTYAIKLIEKLLDRGEGH